MQPVVPLTDREFVQFQRFIHEAAGISLSDAKKPLVSGRLAKRLHHLQFDSYGAYFQLISSGTAPEETQIAIDLLTTNETYFFREARHFEHLRTVLKERKQGSAPFRVWSAACSTGEEPYSIAMVLADLLPPRGWEVLASDVSARVLETARHGHYPMMRAAHVPQEYLRRFCLKGIEVEDGTLLVSRVLRECVEFAQINLNAARLPSLDKFDVIFLRNVLIYFDVETKRRVAQRVLECLRPNGHLYVGHSESLHDMELPVHNVAPAIYRKE
ncbi:chemotaxis protein methyltransferase CheR [Duganella sp. CF458]|uniref:CheR family methyltransferase n=1 Tax=Duganella sp. CF458 TaxID=1884368 RepID=UPI0008E22E9C|nr:protein-glutamate O-methyltransferase CheR [Duganella sp. CF458]SFH02813.1 chemotaxis protein methyltransferase CheR [Duganella sp. CF458]